MVNRISKLDLVPKVPFSTVAGRSRLGASYNRLCKQSIVLGTLLLCCVGVVAGCGGNRPASEKSQIEDSSQEAADPHDVPLTDNEINQLRADTSTWTTALEHISSYRDTIRTETTEGTPAKAHRSLDLLNYVLQWLPETALSSGVAKEDWQSVGENAQILRDAFDRVHANIDAGRASNYMAEADTIEQAVRQLSAIRVDATVTPN